MSEYKIHPIAALFPMLEGDDLQKLADDIKDNGQRMGILRWNGLIIDGRNRLAACTLAGVEPIIVDKDESLSSEKEVVKYIVSANLNRRHMTASERAVIGVQLLELMAEEEEEEKKPASGPDDPLSPEATAVEVATTPKSPDAVSASDVLKGPGEEDKEAEIPWGERTKKVKEVAAIAGTSPSYIHEAKKLKEDSPEKFEEVRSGKKTLSQAKKEIANESYESSNDDEKDRIDEDKALHLVEKCQLALEKLGWKLVSDEIAKIDPF